MEITWVKSQDYNLFELLSDGEFHSGELIAENFGITRSRVWSLINSLENKGVLISRVRGKGYKYNGGSKLLDVPKISDALSGLQVNYIVECSSTNDMARDEAENQIKPLLAVSEYQSGGRGRRGRAWASDFAHNLTFTYMIPNFYTENGLEGLSLVVGYSIARTLSEKFNVGVGVKWPNDIFINQLKLAGVLVEVQGDITGSYNLMIGIGLNVNKLPKLDDRIDVQSLNRVLGKAIDRSALLIAIIKNLMEDIDTFSRLGFVEFKSKWNDLDVFSNQEVQVQQGDRTVVGISRGVDSSGALILEHNGCNTLVHGGEVSLRKVYG